MSDVAVLLGIVDDYDTIVDALRSRDNQDKLNLYIMKNIIYKKYGK